MSELTTKWPECAITESNIFVLHDYERKRANAALERLRAIQCRCMRVRKTSPVARSILAIIGDLPPVQKEGG